MRARCGSPPLRGLDVAQPLPPGVAQGTVRRAPGTSAFGHTKAVKPFLITFLALSVFEVPLFHFIIPWTVAGSCCW